MLFSMIIVILVVVGWIVYTYIKMFRKASNISKCLDSFKRERSGEFNQFNTQPELIEFRQRLLNGEYNNKTIYYLKPEFYIKYEAKVLDIRYKNAPVIKIKTLKIVLNDTNIQYTYPTEEFVDKAHEIIWRGCKEKL